MVELNRTGLSVGGEQAVLIQVANSRSPFSETDGAEDSMEELRSLARTANAEIVGEMVQRRPRIDRRFYLGRGKVQELARLCRRSRAEVVICDDDLSPAQVKNLETALGTKVVDRSELILDIFARHARTRQAKLQVELAQLEYALPRLKKMWTHLDRMAGTIPGGGIGVRGPGEKQLEVDRRLCQKRIHDLKKALAKIERRRRLTAQQRNDKFTTVALVGYTNAGKSTLMNALTGAGVSVREGLFETLDTRTRQWLLSDGRRVMLSDTVGFIRKLPHHLIASFEATLEEAREADLLLHVADAANRAAEAQIDAVTEVLREIGCADKPALLVLNKIDALSGSKTLGGEVFRLPLLRRKSEGSVCISALTGDGLDTLVRQVEQFLDQREVELTVEAALGSGKLLSLLHREGIVLDRTYNGNGTAGAASRGTWRVRVKVPRSLMGPIQSLGGKIHRAEKAK